MSKTRFMKTPYQTLRAKKNNRSKPYLMISELIDNSIGSWDMHGRKDKLTIILTINNNDKKIICEDNAYGMNETELLDSVELNKEKSGNHINMFGVGMKNAAFWFGEDLIIKTNDGQSSNETSVKLSEVKNDSEPVSWEIEASRSPRRFRGTTVRIENVYDDRMITVSELEIILNTLETKYMKYIIQYGVEIKVSYKGKLKRDDRECTLDAKPNNPQIIPEDEIENFIKTFKSAFKDNEVILRGLKEQVIQKVQNKKPLEFIFNVKCINKMIDLKIGINSQSNQSTNNLSKDFKPRFGITAFQSERAIRMAGIDPIKFDKFDYTRTNIKRVYAYCELGEIFRPDNNKSDFNYGSNKDEFKSFTNRIGKDIIILADTVHYCLSPKSKVKPGTKKLSREKLGNALNAKANGFYWEKFAKTKTDLSFKDIEGKEWKVKLLEVDVANQEDTKHFIFAELDKENSNHIEISYNVNHPIWKPLININAIDLKTVLYPLVVIIGLAQIGINNNLAMSWFGPSTNGDYLDAINKIASFGLKI